MASDLIPNEDTLDNPSQLAASAPVQQFKQNLTDKTSAAMKQINESIVLINSMLGSNPDTMDLVRVYAVSRDLYKAMDETRKRLEAVISKIGEEDIPKRFMNEKIKTTNLVDVGRVTVAYRASASMPDKIKGMDWLRENGHPDIIQETVNAGTLASFVKSEFIEKNMDPPDVFKFSTSPYTSITKA